MKALVSLSPALLLVVVLGCGVGEMDPNGSSSVPEPKESLNNCPPPGVWKCSGGIDKGNAVCWCEGMWDCDADPNKCAGKRVVPPGGGDWDCTYVNEYNYTCTKKGKATDVPDGGSDWYCYWSQAEQRVVCSKVAGHFPNGSGDWKCKVDKESGKVECTRTPPTTPKGSGTWDCKTVNGKEVCTKKDGTGLPPGGGSWTCHRTTQGGKVVWVCTGTTGQGGTPPGGGGWNCVKVKTETGKDHWKCTKPDDSGDYPPGGGNWACTKGSEFGGTKCEKVAKPPTPPSPDPKKNGQCKPGTRMWCDGLQYCGWGQVVCKPDGTWPTKTVDGQLVLDCQELKDGRRPNTTCACYHFFYNPACCERADCIVPDNTNGQICKPSAGKLCDYCNPQKSECSVPGGLCVVTNSHETYCTQPCGAGGSCPNNYRCMTVKLKVGKSSQCVPADYSCYY